MSEDPLAFMATTGGTVGVMMASTVVCFVLQGAALPLWRAVLPGDAERMVAQGKPKASESIPANFTAACHAVVAFLLSAQGLLWPASSLLADDGTSTDVFGFSTRSQLSMAVSCGYFIWDLIVSIKEQWGAGFVAHAVACLFVYANALPGFLHYHGLFFLLFEASTPFLHLRWYLGVTGRDKGLLYAITQYTFALAFFVVRIAIGWPVSFYWWGTMLSLLQSGAGPWWSPVICGYLLCNLVLNGLNAFWFYKIVKGALGGGVTQAEAKAGGDKKKGKKAQD